MAVIAPTGLEAEPLLAVLKAGGVPARWLAPERLLGGVVSDQHRHPEIWLFLDRALLAPQLHQDEAASSTPWLVIVDDGDLHLAPQLLTAGAADVWSRSMPDALLLRRLAHQLLLRAQGCELQKQRRYERAVAKCARLLVGSGPLQQHLQHVVETLQGASGVSRAYVFRNHLHPELGLCVSQVHEACAPGIESQLDNPQLQNQPFAADAPNALAALSAGEPFVGLVETLPLPERDMLGSQGILSLLILPIFSGEVFWGFMGFDDCVQPSHWLRDEIALLRIVAETTGLAIERHQAEEELRRIATHDGLTGLANRRHLSEQLASLVGQAERGRLQFCVALLDIDWFKRINDSYGHAAGDAVLQHFARALERSCRSYDVIGRYGGEEFLVAFLHGEQQQLVERLCDLRLVLQGEPARFEDHTIPITFSAGVACSGELPAPLSADALIALADRRLYRSKRLGRDRILGKGPEP